MGQPPRIVEGGTFRWRRSLGPWLRRRKPAFAGRKPGAHRGERRPEPARGHRLALGEHLETGGAAEGGQLAGGEQELGPAGVAEPRLLRAKRLPPHLAPRDEERRQAGKERAVEIAEAGHDVEGRRA